MKKGTTYSAITHCEPGENTWAKDQPYVYCASMNNENKIGYFLLTDPVGSSELSEKAAELVVKIMQRKINEEMKYLKSHDNLEKLLDYSISLANSNVLFLNSQAKKEKPQESGATTLDLCAIYKRKGHIKHIGDGRVYVLYKNGDFKQITEDENSAWLSFKQGHFNSPDEIKVHPSSRDLKNAIGLIEDVKAHNYLIDFNEVDTVLLASDGYYKCVLDKEIQSGLREKDPRKALQKLNRLAKKSAGIIPLLMDVNGYDEETARAILQQDSKSAILIKEVANGH